MFVHIKGRFASQIELDGLARKIKGTDAAVQRNQLITAAILSKWLLISCLSPRISA